MVSELSQTRPIPKPANRSCPPRQKRHTDWRHSAHLKHPSHPTQCVSICEYSHKRLRRRVGKYPRQFRQELNCGNFFTKIASRLRKPIGIYEPIRKPRRFRYGALTGSDDFSGKVKPAAVHSEVVILSSFVNLTVFREVNSKQFENGMKSRREHGRPLSDEVGAVGTSATLSAADMNGRICSLCFLTIKPDYLISELPLLHTVLIHCVVRSSFLSPIRLRPSQPRAGFVSAIDVTGYLPACCHGTRCSTRLAFSASGLRSET